MNVLEQKKKEQKRAIERLMELDSIQRKQAEKFKKQDEMDKQSTFSEISATTTNTTKKRTDSNYYDVYNPYKVKP